MNAEESAGPPLKRYRCTACGNLTRFDVTSTRRTRAFHHFSVSGELSIDDEQVLDETIEEVSCRWCDSPGAVVDYEPGTDQASPDGGERPAGETGELSDHRS